MAISGPNPMAADTPLDFDLLAVVVVDDDVGARDRVAVIDVRLAGWTWWLSEVAPRTRADYSSDDDDRYRLDAVLSNGPAAGPAFAQPPPFRRRRQLRVDSFAVESTGCIGVTPEPSV